MHDIWVCFMLFLVDLLLYLMPIVSLLMLRTILERRPSLPRDKSPCKSPSQVQSPGPYFVWAGKLIYMYIWNNILVFFWCIPSQKWLINDVSRGVPNSVFEFRKFRKKPDSLTRGPEWPFRCLDSFFILIFSLFLLWYGMVYKALPKWNKIYITNYFYYKKYFELWDSETRYNFKSVRRNINL